MHKQLVFGIALSLFLCSSCINRDKAGDANEKLNDPLAEQFNIEVYDSSALSIIEPDAVIEVLAEGFRWSEGPLWVDELQVLLFSDVPANKIYRWSEKDGLRVYLESAGHSGVENKDSGFGPNGLILDRQNNLVICQHGDRRIARMEADVKNPQAQFTTIAEAYKGMKFNSPNDLVMDYTGAIYFTDPPYGQPGNKTGEIGMNGVFKVTPDKEVILLVDTLAWPNGIALSLDEKTLYINQSDPKNPVLYSYEIAGDGSLENGKILFDFKPLAKNAGGLPDGLKVHKSGNIFATGPGGVHVISPAGKHLAAIITGKSTANCAFDTHHEYLYTTTTDMLLRVKLK